MKKIIITPLAPAPIGPYSQAVEVGNMLFLSGQLPIDPTTNELIVGDIVEETSFVMKNIGQVLRQAGYEFANIVKTTIFLSDMKYFSKVNEIYASYFHSDFPAREIVAVLGLPKNANIEISVIACRDK